MITHIRHDSRCPAHRFPAGAQPCGTAVTLALEVRGDAVQSVTLRLWWNDREQRIEMSPRPDGLYAACVTLPDAPGLLWYYFIVRENGRDTYYGNAPDQLGGEGAASPCEPASFQLTVYSPSYRTPEWMRKGILYQIFPDRFHASRPACEKPAPAFGWYHARWDEPPALSIDPETSDNRADDFFGGDLKGIEQKLPYLRSLGVTALYLNPIFRARSNHKYNTGDYMQVDPAFGTGEDLHSLLKAAAAQGIRVLLDGVFSHTGSDSRYFNRFGTYDSVGAFQSPQSPYFSWYSFSRWPGQYDSWWGFNTLPNVNELSDSFLDYVIRSDDSVAAHYLRLGTSGWRLDVADELPMDFLRLLRARVKAENPEAALLGEVWEDASHKVSYGLLRSYCLGDTLDSVMNYPLRDTLIDFLLFRCDAYRLARLLSSLYENYPQPFACSLMNMLGSHDKPRIISVLSGAEADPKPREARRADPLTPQQYALGRARFLKAWRFVCMLPGMPCLYYGDEAGCQGADDPFCRGTYPWGQEDQALLSEITSINLQRLHTPAQLEGTLRFEVLSPDCLRVLREKDGTTVSYTLDRAAL